MAKFVQLTQPNGDAIYVNLDQVRWFERPGSATMTVLIFAGDEKYRLANVKETPAEIYGMALHDA